MFLGDIRQPCQSICRCMRYLARCGSCSRRIWAWFKCRPVRPIALAAALFSRGNRPPVESAAMTAKEKLLRKVLDLDEADAATARIVIERRPAEKDTELEAILDDEGDEILDEMDAEEQKAGFGPWKT